MFTTPDTILVPYDFSAASDGALAQAIAIATPVTEILLLHVFAPPGAFADPQRADERLRLRGRLEEIAGAARRHWRHVRVRTAEGETAEVIRRVARVERADLIVMGTHARKGFSRLVLGSVAEATVRAAACPVLVARERPVAREPGPVLAAIDFSSASAPVLVAASALAALLDRGLQVLHVTSPTEPPPVPETRADPRKLLEQMTAAIRRRGQDPILRLIEGEASATILEQAKESGASFVVMGTHGRRGARRVLLGSVAETVLRASPCPVLVIRNPLELPVQREARP